MKISVVIPAFNEENYIEKCLESILKQEEMPDEIIVVNNNSTDNTVSLVKQYPVRLVNEKIQGMIPARNRGFDEAKYDIIARTDADTIVATDWIKKIKKSFKKDPTLMGLSGRAYFPSIALTKKPPFWPPRAFLTTSKKIFHHDFMFGPNMALKKEAWDKIKHSVCTDDTKVHEDVDLAIHLSAIGKIKFDIKLEVYSSARRAKKLASYIEYPYRYIKMIRSHKKLPTLPSRKNIVKAAMKHPRNLLKKSMALLSA